MTDQPDAVSTTTTIRGQAADPKAGMTVGELQAFTAACARADVDTTRPVKVRVGYRSQITSVEVTG